MENKHSYEKTRDILLENMNWLMTERNLTPRGMSLKMDMNDWYITRILDKKKDPSFKMICKIAEVLRVSVADLFAKKEG